MSTENSETKVGLSSPWVIYVKRLQALFSGDKDVQIVFDNDTTTCNVYVAGLMGKKAECIKKLLPEEIAMGNITLKINVIPANSEPTYEDIVKVAFYGNEYFKGTVTQQVGMLEAFTYGLFSNETIQYFIDDLSNYGGLETAVVADLAKELIEAPTGFYFSTDIN